MPLKVGNLLVFDAAEEARQNRRANSALNRFPFARDYQPGYGPYANEEPFKEWNRRLNAMLPKDAPEQFFVVQIPDNAPIYGNLVGYDIWAFDTDDPIVAHRVGHNIYERFGNKDRMVIDDRVFEYIAARNRDKYLTPDQYADKKMKEMAESEELLRKEGNERTESVMMDQMDHSMQVATETLPSRSDRTISTKGKNTTARQKADKVHGNNEKLKKGW